MAIAAPSRRRVPKVYCARAALLAPFPALLALTLVVYWPGLSGFFLLDDTVNMEGLAHIAAGGDPGQGFKYVFSGISGPTGRPLALLSFALQHWSWPYAPAAFKYVNLLLHLLNGCLLYWLLLKAGWLAAGRTRRVEWWATLVAGLWLLHPLQVSTVLYVVQRMTMLAAMFTFVGLLLYVHGRGLGVDGRARAGYVWMSGGIVLGTVLGTLSKESAVLLPLLVAVSELTFLRGVPRPSAWRWWAAVFLALPLLVILAYLAVRLPTHILPQYDNLRDFTLSQRLLTQSRVLCDYLAKLLLLRPQAFGGYYDAYAVSRGLMAPVSTLPALLILCVLFISALHLRRHAPIYAFAVLGFLAGHALESTILPLELYFEHRNYLPSVAILVGVAYYLPRALTVLRGVLLRRLIAAAVVAVVMSLPLYTLAQARLWGQPLVQARYWAKRDPDSVRALLSYGSMALFVHQDALAAQVFAQLTQRHPGNPIGMLSLAKTACLSSVVAAPPERDLVAALTNGRESFGALRIMDDIVSLEEERACKKPYVEALTEGVKTLIKNPGYRPRRYYLLTLLARLQHAAGKPKEALATLDQARALRRDDGTLLLKVQWLATEGRTAEALELLRTANAQRCTWCLQRLGMDPRVARWMRELQDARRQRAEHPR